MADRLLARYVALWVALGGGIVVLGALVGWDASRWLTLVLFGVGLNLAAFGVRHYYARRKVPAGGTPPGLLPPHVVIIGTATVLGFSSAISNTIERFGEPSSYYVALNAMAVSGWVVAMFLIYAYERLMLKEAEVERRRIGPHRRSSD